jgi:hypothetical protein
VVNDPTPAGIFFNDMDGQVEMGFERVCQVENGLRTPALVAGRKRGDEEQLARASYCLSAWRWLFLAATPQDEQSQRQGAHQQIGGEDRSQRDQPGEGSYEAQNGSLEAAASYNGVPG